MHGTINVSEIMAQRRQQPSSNAPHRGFTPRHASNDCYAARLYFEAQGQAERRAIKDRWGASVDRGIARYARAQKVLGDYQHALHFYDTGRISRARLLHIIHQQEQP